MWEFTVADWSRKLNIFIIIQDVFLRENKSSQSEYYQIHRTQFVPTNVATVWIWDDGPGLGLDLWSVSWPHHRCYIFTCFLTTGQNMSCTHTHSSMVLNFTGSFIYYSEPFVQPKVSVMERLEPDQEFWEKIPPPLRQMPRKDDKPGRSYG